MVEAAKITENSEREKSNIILKTSSAIANKLKLYFLMIFIKLQKTSCFIILQTGKALALARKLKKYQKAEEKWYKNYLKTHCTGEEVKEQCRITFRWLYQRTGYTL